MTRNRRISLSSGLAATGVAIASAWMLGGAVSEFRRRRTTVNPIAVNQVQQLVETGPNRYSRNPMYVGMAGMLLAHAIARRSLISAIPVALFVAIIDRTQIPAEETALHAQLSIDYDQYAAKTPRWLIR